MTPTLQQHWDKVYREKQPNEVSWWQDYPKTSLDFIHSLDISKASAILDIGGGDSKFVDCLLDEGYENITVLDISENAIERAKLRLGVKAERVVWIVCDVNDFKPDTEYDVWHDRAMFHFFISELNIEAYLGITRQTIKRGGYLILGTFSETGPKMCSSLPVRQYDEQSLVSIFSPSFEKIKCITEDHITPFNTKQNFLFCSFRKTT